MFNVRVVVYYMAAFRTRNCAALRGIGGLGKVIQEVLLHFYYLPLATSCRGNNCGGLTGFLVSFTLFPKNVHQHTGSQHFLLPRFKGHFSQLDILPRSL